MPGPFVCSQVTAKPSPAFVGRSVAGCVLPCAPRDAHRHRRPAAQNPARSGLRPRGSGRGSGAVTRSDVDAVPGHVGQGGSVMGHDGAHGGVDPWRTLMPALTVDTRLFVSFAIVHSRSSCNGDRPSDGHRQQQRQQQGRTTVVDGEPWRRGCPGRRRLRTALNCGTRVRRPGPPVGTARRWQPLRSEQPGIGLAARGSACRLGGELGVASEEQEQPCSGQKQTAADGQQ
jgi:hypothetical protein